MKENNKVVIYTSSLCGFCYKAKVLLNNFNIEFSNRFSLLSESTYLFSIKSKIWLNLVNSTTLPSSIGLDKLAPI